MGNLGYNESLDGHIANIDSLSTEFLGVLNEINGLVGESINVSGGAIYGDVAARLEQVWDEKCGSFKEYYNLYQNFVSQLTQISNANKEAQAEADSIYAEAAGTADNA